MLNKDAAQRWKSFSGIKSVLADHGLDQLSELFCLSLFPSLERPLLTSPCPPPPSDVYCKCTSLMPVPLLLLPRGGHLLHREGCIFSRRQGKSAASAPEAVRHGGDSGGPRTGQATLGDIRGELFLFLFRGGGFLGRGKRQAASRCAGLFSRYNFPF